MARPGLDELTAFLAVASHRSFRKAAEELDVSPSAVSHAMRALEDRVGVRLFNRTTRSVALSEAGERLLLRLRPALDDIDAALAEAGAFATTVSGVVRINATERGGAVLLQAVVPRTRAEHPAVALDIVTEGRLVDIVAAGFDCGVRRAELVPQDMVAVPLGGDERFVIVGSPAYMAAKPEPRAPTELLQHECVRYRLPSGAVLRWELERGGEAVALDVHGALTLDHPLLMLDAALHGLGLAYVFESLAAPHILRGALQLVLSEWCPRFPGLRLYYPPSRHPSAALRAFVQVARAVHQGRTGDEPRAAELVPDARAPVRGASGGS